MKILMLADVFFPDTTGGAGRVVYHLSEELSKRGHEVHVITRNSGGKLPSYQRLDINFFVHRFPIPSRESLGLVLSEIKNSYHLTRRLSHEISFDLLCAHQSLVAIGTLLLSPLNPAPFVYYFHSPWHEEFLVKKQKDQGKPGKKTRIVTFLMKRIEKRLLYRSNKVVVLSQYMFDRALDTHHCPMHKIVKIPGGVDLERYQLPAPGKVEAKDAAKLPRHKVVFLTVRNLVPRMGIEALIESFGQSRVLREKGLLLIGGRGFLEDRLKSLVESSNLQDSVRFLGHVPDRDLPRIYQAADFFVLPTSKLEGFGLVILEAMACGTPVLGTPVGAIPELIGAFDEKFIFGGIRSDDMKKTLEEIIEKPTRFKIAPEICRKFVQENFSWVEVTDAFERLLKALIAKPD